MNEQTSVPHGQQWYYEANGQHVGPISWTKLQEALSSGVATPETLVWSENLTEWTRLSQLHPSRAVPQTPELNRSMVPSPSPTRARISQISSIVGTIIGIGLLFKVVIVPGFGMIFPSKESKLLHAVYENIKASTPYPSQVKFHKAEMYIRSDAESKAHRGYLVLTEDPGGLHVYEAAAKIRKGDITVFSRKCYPSGVADYDVDPNFCMKQGLPKQHTFYVAGWTDDLADVDLM